MSGWQRLAVVALSLWVALCVGIVAYDLYIFQQIKEQGLEFVDRKDALRALLDDTYGREDIVIAAKSWLAARQSLISVGVLSWLVPALVWAIYRVGRWVYAGFKQPQEPTGL